MKRLGKIKVSDAFFENNVFDELGIVFANFIPIHIEHRLHMRDIIYTGYSKHFDFLPEGNAIPFYYCTITGENKETAKIKFERETP